MAIDTAEKRRAVAGIPFFIGLGVTPNSSKDVEWRQEAGWGYPGIAPASPGVTPDYVFMTTSAFAVTEMTAGAFAVTEMTSDAFSVTEMDGEALDNG